jgi:hypothetical protein
MSSLGQKQTLAAQKGMSALPPKADIGRPILSSQNSGGIIACPPGSTSGGPFAHCPALSVQSAGFHTSEVACEQRSVNVRFGPLADITSILVTTFI